MKFGYVLSLLLVIPLDSPVNPQLLRSGKCRRISSSSNYNLMDLTGTWYEISGTSIPNLNLRKCVVMNVTGDNSNTFKISVSYVAGRTTRNLNGAITIIETNDGYQAQIQGLNVKTHFYIVELNSRSYAVFYACASFLGLRSEAILILSRQRTLSSDIETRAVQNLKNLKLPVRNLKQIDQSNCQ